MTTNAKLRLTAFIIITVVLSIFSVMYADEAHSTLYPVTGMTDDMGEIYIDGSDFTRLLTLGIVAFEGLFGFMVCAVYTVIVIFGSLISYLILRFSSIRKTTEITALEWRISLIIFWAVPLVAFIVSIFLTSISFVIFSFLMFAPIPLFASLLYVLALKKRVTA